MVYGESVKAVAVEEGFQMWACAEGFAELWGGFYAGVEHSEETEELRL